VIVRNFMKCKTCGHVNTTRTAVGHGSYQEFAFPCQGCGIELRFGMEIDHENPDYEYTKIVNAEWTDEGLSDDKDFSTITTVVLDGENLVPITGEVFSPFMSTANLPENPVKFRMHQGIRFHMAEKIWPMIEKLLIHENNRNEELFDKQKAELGYRDECSSWEERILLTLHILQRYGEIFSPDRKSAYDLIRQRINLSETVSSTLHKDLLDYLIETGKSCTLFKEIMDIRKRWVYLYPMLSPVYIVFYWSEKANSLDYYTLAQKRFEELKPFYVDCFETLCRISVLAAAIEGIIWNKSLTVKTSKKLINITTFDEMPNGSKRNILKNLVIGDLFTPFIENRIRNGIGHHTARYDVHSDLVTYSNRAKRGTEWNIIPYVQFCEKVVRLYVQVQTVSIYAHWAKARAEGITGRII
jgi:hypothetical protein